MGERLEPAQWYASLPSFLSSASALITDPFGAAVLAVKPNYRDHWNVPGGIMEAGEPPHLCCAREVAEELGIELEVGRLLVVDWVPPTEQRKAWFGFLFDGGVLDNASRISLQVEELEDVDFIARTELHDRLTANTADRVQAALLARESGGVAYLYDGALVQHASWRRLTGAGRRYGSAPVAPPRWYSSRICWPISPSTRGPPRPHLSSRA